MSIKDKGLYDVPEPYHGAISGTNKLCCNCKVICSDIYYNNKYNKLAECNELVWENPEYRELHECKGTCNSKFCIRCLCPHCKICVKCTCKHLDINAFRFQGKCVWYSDEELQKTKSK